MLCLCLHHQAETVKQSQSVGTMEELAIVADKYGCINAVRFVLESWLAQADILHTKSPGSLIHTAYLLDDAVNFGKLTGRIIGDGYTIKAWPETSYETVERIYGMVFNLNTRPSADLAQSKQRRTRRRSLM